MAAERSLHFLLATIGSAGDVHPFVGIGQALQRRGHRVSIITGGYFAPLIERAGLEFVELFSAELYQEMLGDPDVWHPQRGPKTVMRMGVAPMVRKLYEIIAARNVPGQTVVGASSLALGALFAQEHLGVPTASIHLQPLMMRSVICPSKLAGMATQTWLPRSLIRAQFWMADRLFADRWIGGDFRALRSELGLPPVKRILDRWCHAPRLTIGMFPAWFAPPQPDWPPQVRLTGFPLYDEQDVTPLDEDLERFLAAGSPPIAFTPGSAMTFGQKFFGAAVDACRRLGRRGLLLTRHAEQIPADLPPEVRHCAFAPFTKLLPHCAALVNHGGIGTMSQAFAAGVPQVVMPMSHDQPDNIERAERLGVAAALYPGRFRGDGLAAVLRSLLESPGVAKACRDVAAKIAGATPLDDTARLLEGLAAPAK